MNKILLLLFSIVLSLLMCEALLFANGRYNDLVDTTYSRDAIWGPPEDTTQYVMHPVLHFDVPVKYDHSGVRNDGPIETKDKKNIYAFFGDSMTENKRILSEFTFTEILNRLIPNVAVVNYGVGGYGLDQEYIRYKKFSYQDIKRVFYVFSDTDISDLYETNLVDINQDDELVFLTPQANWVRYAISKLRVTYLLLEAYIDIKNLFIEGPLASKNDLAKVVGRWKQKKPFKKTKEYDQEFSHLIREQLATNTYVSDSKISECRRKFRLLLQYWSNDLTKKGIRFDIVVMPGGKTHNIAVNLFGDLPLKVLYLREYLGNTSFYKYRFVNNNHLNEDGNLFTAVSIYKYLGRDLSADDAKVVDEIRENISALYAPSSQ